jgi:hypothetical protein
MLQRCDNPKAKSWPEYGGRGVKVCVRRYSFPLFLKDMGVRPEGKTIDRINGRGNYTPKNCRWATPLEQVHNRISAKKCSKAQQFQGDNNPATVGEERNSTILFLPERIEIPVSV